MLDKVIRNVSSQADDLGASAEVGLRVMETTLNNVETLQRQTGQVALAVKEMSATTLEVAKSTNEASQMADVVRNKVAEGQSTAQSTQQIIELLSVEVEDASEVIAGLMEETKNIGDFLHSCYPDEIRTVTTSEIFAKYELLHEFQECNMGVHRTESFFFNNDEYSSTHKWDVFENIFVNDVETNNGITNFNIGHTYVGRQNYDKFSHFDMDLTYNDFYNFEKIEYSFNFNLSKPENIPFSEEFINWSKRHNQKPKGLQIPIGNVVDLESNLTKYRTVLYTNIKSNNKVSIEI